VFLSRTGCQDYRHDRCSPTATAPDRPRPLQALGAPEAELPRYDASKHEPIEEIDIEEIGHESEAIRRYGTESGRCSDQAPVIAATARFQRRRMLDALCLG
jgi:hypothetical protein